jgi:signal transduction histidine kinase
MAEREISRVSHIAKQTLGFYRQNETPRLVRVNTLVSELLEIYRPKIESKGLEIIKRCEDAQIVAMAGELRQVLANLLLNAVEAAPEKGRLHLRIRRTRRWSDGAPAIRITVADQGPGIPASNRAKLFEPFFTTKSNGTGLGLWTVKETVVRHNGHVFLRSSTRAGRSGTCIAIVLPAVQTEPAIDVPLKEYREVIS